MTSLLPSVYLLSLLEHVMSDRKCMMLLFCLVQDLKANESRLRDINKVASELESEGLMAEEAPAVQAQVSSTLLV